MSSPASALHAAALLLVLTPFALAAAPLGPEEAAEIVSAEESARRQAAADRLEQLDARPALDRSYLDLGDRRLLYNRTAPAARTAHEAMPAVTDDSTVTPTPGAADEAPSKPHHTLFLSATIYEGPVTELRWSHAGREYHAFSAVDFRDFGDLGLLETEDAIHSVFLSIAEDSRASLAENARPPELAEFTRLSADHLVVTPPDTASAPSTDPDAAATLATLKALHAHHRAHAAELRAARQRREALAAARETYLRENPPPPPPDTVINFAPSIDSASRHAR